MMRFSAVAAPALMLLYGLCRTADGRDGDRGNGIAWDIGHVAFFAAMVLFAVLFVRLARDLPRPRPLMAAAAAAALTGAGCFLWVIAGDLSGGFRSAAPLPEALEVAGPVLFQVGALAILIRYVVARRLPVWSPVLVLLGFGAVGVSLDLLAVGALLIGAGLAPLAMASRSRGADVPTR